MSVILGSTGITFPDATTQTTAATAGGQLQAVLFGSSTTWTAPANVTKVYVICVGGGAGGVANTYGCGGGVGGNGGGVAIALVTVVPATVYTITIGAASASTTGSAPGYISGTAGGASSFGSLVTATGGSTNQVNSAGAVISGAVGSGSTTGTLIKNSYISWRESNYSYGTTAPLTGINYYYGGTAAVVYSASTLYTAGLGGSSQPTGGIGGAIFIQYVG